MAAITFTKELEGYALHVRTRQLSLHTASDYWHTFKTFSQFLDGTGPALSEIGKQSFTQFFASLADQGLSRKTVRNAHAGQRKKRAARSILPWRYQWRGMG